MVRTFLQDSTEIFQFFIPFSNFGAENVSQLAFKSDAPQMIKNGSDLIFVHLLRTMPMVNYMGKWFVGSIPPLSFLDIRILFL